MVFSSFGLLQNCGEQQPTGEDGKFVLVFVSLDEFLVVLKSLLVLPCLFYVLLFTNLGHDNVVGQ